MTKRGSFVRFRGTIPLAVLGCLLISCPSPTQSASSSRSTTVHDQADWTFIFYYNADNNLESYMMADMAEIKSSVRDTDSVRVVVLIDRIAGYSSDAAVFGEDFTGTRLYEFGGETPVRLDGGAFFPSIHTDSETELDVGSVANLRALIQFSKTFYPAQHYALCLGNHGSGVGNYPAYSLSGVDKAISYDDTDQGFIPVSDFRDQLTSDDSVDLLMLDACFMNYAEVAYQVAPIQAGRASSTFSAAYLLASPAEVVAEGFPYDTFFAKLLAAPPGSLSGADVGELMLQAQKEHLATYGTSPTDSVARLMTYSLLDLAKLDAFKSRLDALANSISAHKSAVVPTVFGNATKATITNSSLLYYFSPTLKNWVYYPGVDAFSMLDQLKANSSFAFSEALIESCQTSLEAVILDSFGSTAYTGFQRGKNGLALFFPKGNLLYLNATVWSRQTWYGPVDLSWCSDGATPSNGVVENWYELMNSWWATTSEY